MNIFEQASRLSLRFETTKGSISADGLWSMPLTGAFSLDALAVSIHNKVESTPRVSFVTKSENPELDLDKLRLEIVLHVIEDRQLVAAAKSKEKALESERNRLKTLIANKEDEQLANLSADELKKRLAEIGG